VLFEAEAGIADIVGEIGCVAVVNAVEGIGEALYLGSV
jgi:hypothetical protein